MEKVKLSKYELIKAVLASNLEEGVKEALVNSIINSRQPRPIYYGLTTTSAPFVKKTWEGDATAGTLRTHEF